MGRNRRPHSISRSSTWTNGFGPPSAWKHHDLCYRTVGLGLRWVFGPSGLFHFYFNPIVAAGVGAIDLIASLRGHDPACDSGKGSL